MQAVKPKSKTKPVAPVIQEQKPITLPLTAPPDSAFYFAQQYIRNNGILPKEDYERLKQINTPETFLQLAALLDLELPENVDQMSMQLFELQAAVLAAMFTQERVIESLVQKQKIAFVWPKGMSPLSKEQLALLKRSFQADEERLNQYQISVDAPLTAVESQLQLNLLASTQEALQDVRTNMVLNEAPSADVALVDSAREAMTVIQGQASQSEQLNTIRKSVNLSKTQAGLVTALQSDVSFFASLKTVVGAGMSAGIFASLLTLIGTGSFGGLGPILLAILGAMGVEAVKWIAALLNRFVVQTTETEVEQFKQGNKTLETKIATSPSQLQYKKLPNFNLSASLYALLSLFVFTFMFKYVLQQAIGQTTQSAVAYLTGTVATQLNTFALSSLAAWGAQAIRTGVSAKLLLSDKLNEKTKSIIRSWGPLAEGFLFAVFIGGASYTHQLLMQAMPSLSIKEHQELIDEIKSTPVQEVSVDFNTVQVNGESLKDAFTMAQETSPVVSLAQPALITLQQAGVTPAIGVATQTQLEQAVKAFVVDGASQLRLMTPKSAAVEEALKQAAADPSKWLSLCYYARYAGPVAMGLIGIGVSLIGGAGLIGATVAGSAAPVTSYLDTDTWESICRDVLSQYGGWKGQAAVSTGIA